MNEYDVECIHNLFEEPVKVKAKSPLEALKKAYPHFEFKRVRNGGNYIVGRKCGTINHYGGYRIYIYEKCKAGD